MTELWSGIIGIIFGFILSEFAEFVRDARSEKRTLRTAKHLLRLEIDSNYQLLVEFWSQVQAPRGKSAPKNLWECTDSFLVTPYPQWRTTAFYSQYSVLINALTQSELKNCFEFYADLDRLNAVRDIMVRSHATQTESENMAAAAAGRRTFSALAIADRALDKHAERFWSLCEEIISRRISAQNPVGLNV